eukprot:1158621-Pelagomonas_calceolata.AAC.8
MITFANTNSDKAWVKKVRRSAKEASRASEEPLPLWRGLYGCGAHAQQHQSKLGSFLGSASQAPETIKADAPPAASQ